MEKPSLPAAYAALTISALVWGGSIVGQKLALGAFSAVETSLIRGIGALGILVPLWWWTEGGRTTLTPRDLKSLSLLGLGVLGNHLLTLFGLRYVGASTAGVLIGASPVVTALLSSLLVRDISFKKVAGGCAVSFAGVALVSGAGGDAPIGAVATVEHNLACAGREPTRFEGRAQNRRIDPRYLPAWRAFMEREAQGFLERVDEWLSTHEADGDGVGIRLGAGVYAIHETQSGAAR